MPSTTQTQGELCVSLHPTFSSQMEPCSEEVFAVQPHSNVHSALCCILSQSPHTGSPRISLCCQNPLGTAAHSCFFQVTRADSPSPSQMPRYAALPLLDVAIPLGVEEHFLVTPSSIVSSLAPKHISPFLPGAISVRRWPCTLPGLAGTPTCWDSLR